jgi:hypothetical protein
LSGAGLVAAAERIEATLATSGWADIVGVLDEEIARINQQLGGSEPLEHAKYAHLCGQLRGLVAIGETVSTVLTKRDEWLAEQAEKHEGMAGHHRCGRTTTNILSAQRPARDRPLFSADRISLLEPDSPGRSRCSVRALPARAAAPSRHEVLVAGGQEQAALRRCERRVGGANTTVVQHVGVTSTTARTSQQHDQVLNTRTGEQIRVDGVAGNTLHGRRAASARPRRRSTTTTS